MQGVLILLVLVVISFAATGTATASESSQSKPVSPDDDRGLALPYPDRTAYEIKGIQPDFWSDRDEIAGHGPSEGAAGGVSMNLVWEEWEPTILSLPCVRDEIEYDGHCFVIPPATASVDEEIREYSARGVVVTAIVYGVPEWARIVSCPDEVHVENKSFCAPADPADYARFVGMLAQRYNGLGGNGRIADFVIHDEVNNSRTFNIGCGPELPTPCDQAEWLDTYADNYNAAYDQVLLHQPTAKVFISLDNHFVGPSTYAEQNWDQPNRSVLLGGPLLSGQTFLTGFASRVGSRVWRVAYHAYPPFPFREGIFLPDDLRRYGKVTLGSAGALAGWLYQQYPDSVAAREIHFTEQGIPGFEDSSRGRQSDHRGVWSESQQSSWLCESFQNVLGTPGIDSYLYYRMQDNIEESENFGLRRLDGTPRLSWTTWALANRVDLDPPQLSCGFENLPQIRLRRAYTPSRGHWVSSRRSPPAFVLEQSYFLARDPIPGTSLLFECLVPRSRPDGFRIDHNLISRGPGCEGLPALGPVGYIFDEPRVNRTALYRCAVDGITHFVSASPTCEGVVFESLLGYTIDEVDTDSDGAFDAIDNCTVVANRDQRDTDGDGYGNLCDADLDNNGVVNFNDLSLFRAAFFAAGDRDEDFNGDGVVNFFDLSIMRSRFFLPPGPSGFAP